MKQAAKSALQPMLSDETLRNEVLYSLTRTERGGLNDATIQCFCLAMKTKNDIDIVRYGSLLRTCVQF